MTIILIIISSDKTLLTLFQDKQAYSIYLTIGNIPKDICCKPLRMAQILIGYILITKLPGLTNKVTQCQALANLFHACMWEVLHLIAEPGETGVAMMSGDGMWWCCHPISLVITPSRHLSSAHTMDDAPNAWLPLTNSENANPSCLAFKVRLSTHIILQMGRSMCFTQHVTMQDWNPSIILSGNCFRLQTFSF